MIVWSSIAAAGLRLPAQTRLFVADAAKAFKVGGGRNRSLDEPVDGC